MRRVYSFTYFTVIDAAERPRCLLISIFRKSKNMSRKLRLSIASSLFAVLALPLSMAACSESQKAQAGSGAAVAQVETEALDPILADPRVGDLYAADLTHFSGAEFSGTGSSESAFGLMRVIEVSEDLITLNTETGAWPLPRGAINELRGDLAEIEWDEEEKVRIYRKELADLVAEEKILEVRRR